MKNKEVYEDINPQDLSENDLIHVEVDPSGVSHIYSTLNLPTRNHIYHPEWDEYWREQNAFLSE